MADNVLYNPPSTGVNIATDQVPDGTGPHYQYVKLADGTLNSTTVIAGSANGLKVDESSASLNSAQTAVTTSAVALPASACVEALIQSDPGNTVNILLGHSSATTPIVLQPGQSISIPIQDLNLVYAKAAASGTSNVNWMTRNG